MGDKAFPFVTKCVVNELKGVDQAAYVVARRMQHKVGSVDGVLYFGVFGVYGIAMQLVVSCL